MSKVSESALDVRVEIIEKLHRDLGLPINTIRAVIDNQFKTAMQAIKTETSIEITGFGRFTLIEARVNKRKQKYLEKVAEYDAFLLSNDHSEHAKNTVLEKKIALERSINDLNHKQNVFKIKRDSRGVEK